MSNEEVGIKLKSVKTKHVQLLYESEVYKMLQDGGKLDGLVLKVITMLWYLIYLGQALKTYLITVIESSH